MVLLHALFIVLALASASAQGNDTVIFMDSAPDGAGNDVNTRFGYVWVTGVQQPTVCSCVPSHSCQPKSSDGSGQIDIRIVTTPPAGVVCGSSLVYCCSNNGQQVVSRCGTRTTINYPGVTLQAGQASFGKYPWAAMVLDEKNGYVGGGALISSTQVLTAAHKVAPYLWNNGAGVLDARGLWSSVPLKVRLGEWNAQADTEPYKYMEYQISKISIHPQFNPNNLFNDIAVITLQNSVPLGPYPNINSVCLSASRTDFTGSRCWVSGWGKNAFGPTGTYQNIMKEVDVPILPLASCQERLRGTRLGQNFLLDSTSFMCAGGEQGKDACTGDGGSPLVCQSGDQFYLVGMVAWGIGCADSGIPGVYVNVLNFQDWISKQT